ncbi:MAG TPA: NAD(P)H-dependent glycerol-3-phosphate dehydrogenase [Vicinamibacterales bacterium]|nr:NAD(P)H-dependent glycerol-3-phosphate dehydrogenase [Vicinamibacterales bacterium]
MRCAVIGAGAWGTALADLLATNGADVTLWALERDVAATINARHENPRFLPGASLSPAVEATNDLGIALESAALVVYAVPSAHLRSVVRSGAPHVARDAILVVATKGIEQQSLALMTDVVEAEVRGRPVVAVSGPSFAAEVVARQPTAVVAASRDVLAAQHVQEAMSSATFRVYTHDDVVGVELGGSLKNVMAVATGIAEGVGLGVNSRAALITRGLAEMTRLGIALGAQEGTFAGLAGIGDLVLTCTGALSRNRAVGVAIGKGATLAQALAGKETVAEGVATAQSARELAHREGIEMPIVETVHRVLFESYPAHQSVIALMSRELRAERDA